MSAEDQLRKLKEIPPLSKGQKRRNTVTAVLLAISTFISVLFLVYAFIQKTEADKQFELAIEAKMEADKQRAVAIFNERAAMEARVEAEKQRALAAEELEACRKSKK